MQYFILTTGYFMLKKDSKFSYKLLSIPTKGFNIEMPGKSSVSTSLW